MHYRNGRMAKNGDTIVKIDNGKIAAMGVLYDSVAGNDYCNGNIAPVQATREMACAIDCLHVEDVMAMLRKNGLAARPDAVEFDRRKVNPLEME